MAVSESGHSFEPNDTFADYTILQFCGHGAYGEVYLAEDITRKKIALKIMPIQQASEIWRMELIGLRHYRQSVENYHALVEIYHVGETEDYFYYTMEAADNMLREQDDQYVADTLSHRLSRGGRLAPEKVLELAHSMLDALEELSEHDLAHRDIKPANIIFVNGKAKLSDIGLITNTGICAKLVGTADFLPPELADGDPVGYGNDLYALGKVLYCALTGMLPEHFPEVPLSVPLPIWRQFKPVLLRACSADPRARFFTSQEFRQALPGKIREPNAQDQLMESIRAVYRKRPRFWQLAAVGTLLVGLAAGTTFGYFYWQNKKHAKHQQARIDSIFDITDALQDQFPHLKRIAESSDQQARYHQLEILLELATMARAESNWNESEKICEEVQNSLRNWAEKDFQMLLAALPGKEEQLTPSQAENAWRNCYDFTETPLYGYLTPESRTRLDGLLENFQTQLAQPDGMPVPGQEWCFNGDLDLKFVYVPAGKLNNEPKASYWIGINEVTRSSYRALIGKEPEGSGEHTPVIHLSWNEQLEFCARMTELAAKSGTLPAGYIYRPPYASEWDFAFKGGWRSAGTPDYEKLAIGDLGWYSSNSNYQPHPVRLRQANMLGLFDMAGNVSETVLMDGSAPNRAQLGQFGASFRDRRISEMIHDFCDPDQIDNSWSGFRIVLGPEAMDYTERYWYTGRAYSLQLPTIRYEILGGPDCRWTGSIAKNWCVLLTGNLACLEQESTRDFLMARSERLQAMQCLVGAELTGQAWLWQHKHHHVVEGSWLESEAPADAQHHKHTEHLKYLTFDHGFWRGIPETQTVPLLMIEWPRERWAARRSNAEQGILNDPASPLILNRELHADNEWVLLKAPVDWYTAKRLAELLGGSLVMPKSESEKEQVLKMTEHFGNVRIALGGYSFCGKWRWLDKSDGPETLPESHTRTHTTLNDCFIACYQNQLCSCDSFDALLCKLPLASSAEKSDTAVTAVR